MANPNWSFQIKKAKVATSISNISEDLFIEILCRLPVKSIAISRCVCKSWQALLTDIPFIEFHSNRTNLTNPNLLLITYPSTFFHTLQTDFLEQSVNLNLNFPPTLGIKIVGSCNGLVCLSDYKTFVSLLNPSTKEYVQLPSQPIGEIPKHKQTNVTMGFGYNSIIKEYKVVRIVSVTNRYNSGSIGTMVYTIGGNWKRIEGNEILSTIWYVESKSLQAHVNGVLHFKGVSGKGKHLMSFNLRNEEFGEVSWPDWPELGSVEWEELNLAVWEGCLAVFRKLIDQYRVVRVDIWMMSDYGVKESWIIRYSIRLPMMNYDAYTFRPLVFLKNGDILLHIDDKNLLLYDPDDNQPKVMFILDAPIMFKTTTYVDSLTSIASLMAGNRVQGQ